MVGCRKERGRSNYKILSGRGVTSPDLAEAVEHAVVGLNPCPSSGGRAVVVILWQSEMREESEFEENGEAPEGNVHRVVRGV